MISKFEKVFVSINNSINRYKNITKLSKNFCSALTDLTNINDETQLINKKENAEIYYTTIMSKYGIDELRDTTQYKSYKKRKVVENEDNKMLEVKYESEIYTFESLDKDDQKLVKSARWDQFYRINNMTIHDKENSKFKKIEFKYDVWNVMIKEIGFDFEKLLQFIVFRNTLMTQ